MPSAAVNSETAAHAGGENISAANAISSQYGRRDAGGERRFNRRVGWAGVGGSTDGWGGLAG
jgi:hypothetical protein